jgi:hypothetical protein
MPSWRTCIWSLWCGASGPAQHYMCRSRTGNLICCGNDACVRVSDGFACEGRGPLPLVRLPVVVWTAMEGLCWPDLLLSQSINRGVAPRNTRREVADSGVSARTSVVPRPGGPFQNRRFHLQQVMRITRPALVESVSRAGEPHDRRAF